MNHVVIASYHGVGRSLDFIRSKNLVLHSNGLYIYNATITFSESRKNYLYSNLTPRMHTWILVICLDIFDIGRSIYTISS